MGLFNFKKDDTFIRVLTSMEERLTKLENHKILQIDENRKISRTVDELEQFIREMDNAIYNCSKIMIDALEQFRKFIEVSK